MALLDTIIVIIIAAIGLGILYKALKEPIDWFFGLLKRGFLSARERMGERAPGDYYETIRYG